MSVHMEHYRWEDVAKDALSKSIQRQMITGEKAMIARFEIAKGGVVTEHHHESEQISCVFDGAHPVGGSAQRGGSRRHGGARRVQPDPHGLAHRPGRVLAALNAGGD